MEFFLVSLLNGVSYGLLLFMLSSGLTLIFSMMGVLNFAHASFYMLGAYFAYQISSAVGFWPALLLAPLLVGVVGAAIERYGLRRVHRYGHVPELLFTFGLAYLIEEVVHLIWGRIAVDYRIPEALDFGAFHVFDSVYPAYRVFMMAVSIAMLGALYWTLTRTRIGLIIRAALTPADMVQALGHNVPRVFMLVFGGGCALAALAGVIGGYAFWRRVDGVAEANARADEVLEAIGLARRRESAAGELTYAEQRALEIGVTIACGADVILLDEPTAGMSRSESAAAVALIRKVTAGKTLVMVEHDMDVVFGLADRVSVLVYGEVIATGAPDAIHANARVQEAYLGTGLAHAGAAEAAHA